MAENIIHKKICSIEDCDRKHFAKNYCHMHYIRLRKHGSTDSVLRYRSPTGICSVFGCENKHTAKGFCRGHLRRFNETGSAGEPFLKYGPVCRVDSCENPTESLGYCMTHYHRHKRHGDPLGGRANVRGEPFKWLISKANHDGEECLLWPFGRYESGYGYVCIGEGKRVTASREMCRIVYGDPPSEDMHAAHSCGNGHLGCTNPNHLRWATPQENSGDKFVHGTAPLGSNHHNAKLSEADIFIIRSLFGSAGNRAIADMFGVSSATIGDIKHGRTWAWLDSQSK